MGEDCRTMPFDYASYQIDLGHLEVAIETLEQGRALLLSEMRGLRAPMAQLIEEDPPLAKRFAEINQELEALTISITEREARKRLDGPIRSACGKAAGTGGGAGCAGFTDPMPTRVGRILEGAIIRHSSFRRLAWPRHPYQPLQMAL